MTTKTSFSNQSKFVGFYKNALKRHMGLGLFFAALTGVFLPVQYLLTLFNISRISPQDLVISHYLFGVANTYNGVAVAMFTIIELVLPVVLGINIFSYMHSKQAVDVFHALPISRKDLFLGNFAAGYTMIAASLIVNFALIWVVSSFNFGITQALGVLVELLVWLAITFTIYAITVLAMVNVGTIFDGFAFTMALLGGFSAIYGIIFALMQQYVFGFADISMPLENMIKLSPVATLVERISFNSRRLDQSAVNENLITVAVWFVIALVVTYLAIKSYQHRKSEMAQTVGNIGPLQILGRAEAVFAGGVILAALFVGVFNFDGKTPFALAAVVGAFIAYLIMDLVLSRSVSTVFKSLHVAAIGAVVTGGLVFVISNGFFVYENKVPRVDDVDSIMLGYTTMYSDESARSNNQSEWIRYPIVVRDPGMIENLVNVHQLEVQNKDSYESPDEFVYYATGIRMEYTLKNGRKLYRTYNGIHSQNIENMVKLEAADEVVSQIVPIFTLPLEDLRDMHLYTITSKNDFIYTFTKSDYQKLVEAVKYDLLSITPEQLLKKEVAIGYIGYDYLYVDPNTSIQGKMATYEFTAPSNYDNVQSSYIMITDSFTNTIKLLKDLGVYDQLTVDLSNVKQGLIIDEYYSYNGSLINRMPFYKRNDLVHLLQDEEYGKARSVKVSDPQSLLAEVKDSLTHQVVAERGGAGEIVLIGFELENGDWAFYYMNHKELPLVYQQKLEEVRNY